MSLTLTILTYVLFFASSLATWGGFLYSRRIRRENKALSLALVRSPEGELVGKKFYSEVYSSDEGAWRQICAGHDSILDARDCANEQRKVYREERDLGHRVPPGFKHRIVLVSAVRRPIDEYDPASPEGEAL